MTLSKSFFKKKGRCKIDLEHFFRSQVEGLLIVASWVDAFKDELGIEGVSQVWGLRPSWYFWISGSPGVYQLELVDTETDDRGGAKFHKAKFIIKCYPFPGHHHFSKFSLLEQAFVQSRYFDSTHSPVYETREQIPQDLYNVATLELMMDKEDRLADFVFETFDTLRSVYLHDTERSFREMNFRHSFKAGEIDRNLPALEIGYPLFDCLLSLFSYARKNQPQRVNLSHFQGFEFALDKDDVRLHPSDDIHGYRLQVSYFLSSCGEIPDLFDLVSPFPSHGHSVIYNRDFGGHHYHPTIEKQTLPTPLNTKWWTLAETDYSSNLTSSCGCH